MKQFNTIFKESTLSFCIGSKNILYTSLVPFFVNEIFNRLQDLEEMEERLEAEQKEK